jgi:hypothetical protein
MVTSRKSEDLYVIDVCFVVDIRKENTRTIFGQMQYVQLLALGTVNLPRLYADCSIAASVV